MVRRSFVPVWTGIIFLSGMFLIGQDAWEIREPPSFEGEYQGTLWLDTDSNCVLRTVITEAPLAATLTWSGLSKAGESKAEDLTFLFGDVARSGGGTGDELTGTYEQTGTKASSLVDGTMRLRLKGLNSDGTAYQAVVGSIELVAQVFDAADGGGTQPAYSVAQPYMGIFAHRN